MMALLQLLLLLACVEYTVVFGSPIRAFHSKRNTAPVVDLGYAQYSGYASPGTGVSQFLGMRYAKAPLGDLRWRAPQSPDTHNTKGLLPATDFGPICIGVGQDSSSTDYSEDCLFINVFAPTNANSKSKLPVWFYIQGGGYATNSNANYNGTDVVMKSGHGLVLVNFNYRVGAFGFLASEKVREDGDLNVGLLDQRKALEWVQKYIHLFGGDPDHVVIHGASAGGGSVAYHLTAYGGRDDGLFVGAMPESPFFPTSRTVAESEFQFSRLVDQTGCDTATDQLACLRGLDLATIQTHNVVSPFPGATGDPKWYFLPVIDGIFSQKQMYEQFNEGKFIKVPTLVGGDSDEGDVFVPNATTQEEVNAFLVDNYPKLTTADLKAIDTAYPPVPRYNHGAYFAQASQMYGNATFTCGGLLISAAVSRYLGSSRSWNYRYNVVDPSAAAEGLGVTHTSETPAIFGVGYAGGENTALATTNAAIVPVVMDYYISFVTALNPNTRKNEAAPYFEGFGRSKGERLVLQLPVRDTVMERVPDVQLSGCDVWDRLAHTMEV